MSGYDFSPLYRSAQSAVSPGSTFLATAHANRLIIRSSQNLAIVRTWEIQSLGSYDGSAGPSKTSPARTATIDEVQWSGDGLYILAFSRAEQCVWVYALAQEGNGGDGEVVRIKAGPEGLESVGWVKDGREIMCRSDHNLRLTIHDLPNGTSSYINNSSGTPECQDINSKGRYLAVVERHGNSEHIGVYDVQDRCNLVRHFPIATASAQMLQWSPCGRYIAVAESWLSYKVYIYSPIGPLISRYPSARPSASPADLQGCGSGSGSGSGGDVDNMGLGVKCMVWCPGGRAVLLGRWDGKVEVVDPVTGRCLAAIPVSRKVGKGVAVWQEPVDWLRDTRSRGIVQFDRHAHPPLIPSVQPNLSAVPPLSGPTHLLPSPSGSYFALAHSTQPSAVHIYALCPSAGALPDVRHLCVMLLREGVRDAEWASRTSASAVPPNMNGNGSSSSSGAAGRPSAVREKILVVSKTGAVYVWEKDGWVDEETDDGVAGEGGVVEGVGIPNAPPGFTPTSLHVSPDGRAFVIHGKKDFCVMYDEDEDEDDHAEPDGLSGIDSTGGSHCAAHATYARHASHAGAEKAWESEGLSLVMEAEEDDEEGEGEKEEIADDRGLATDGRYDGIANANGDGSARNKRAEPEVRRSILSGKAWRPSDVYVS